MRTEKRAMPVTLLANAAKRRGIDPANLGALKQIANKSIDPTRRREIAKNMVGYLRGVKTAAMRDELLELSKQAFLQKLVKKLVSPVSTSALGTAGRGARRSVGGVGTSTQMARGRSFGGNSVDQVRKAQLERMRSVQPSGLSL